jgi:GDP/UDP-N,N'-diacetylbacillosamine 2-epimerase (hydrolysing)
MRKVCYISGTRADFGLMRSTLTAIRDHAELGLSIIVTGMHLSPQHGDTVREIEAADLTIAAKVPVPLAPATGATMARNIGAMTTAFTDALESLHPDIVLLLGDRGEMLAGAIASLHLNIPVAHIHGGELSGTVDEPVRHAISKLSHLHFTATAASRERLVRMGEAATNIHVTGAPGLDGLTEEPLGDRLTVARQHGLNADRPFALMVYHPVLQEADTAGADARALLDALHRAGVQVLALMPNADGGSEAVRQVLTEAHGQKGVTVRTHLARPDFIAAMASADLLIGNSSAGIIEAASFGTPVINVGRRQNLRERNVNVRDVVAQPAALAAAITAALAQDRFPVQNVYGDGRTSERIADLLATTPLNAALMMKVNGY